MSELVVAFPKMEDAKAIKNILAKNGFRVAGLSQSAAGQFNYVIAMAVGY